MTCRCIHRRDDEHRIRYYVAFTDGTIWAIYGRCPVHDCERIEVVWFPGLWTEETAAVSAATVLA